MAQTPVGFMVSSATGDNGDQVSIDITTTNFERMVGLQFSVFWDPDVLSFSSLSNLNGDIGLSMSSFSLDNGNIVIPGELQLSWDSQSAPSLDDGAVLFTINLDVVGSPCDETAISIDDPSNPFQTIDVLQLDEGGNFIEADFTLTDGTFSIPGEGCGNMGEGDVTFIASNETGDPGEEVCVSVSVQNFENVAGAGFTITYDPAVLDFEQFRNPNLPGLSGGSFSIVSPGELRFSWSTPTTMGITRPDGEVIFDICFTIIGSNGTSSSIDFSNADVVINDGSMPVEETPNTVSGSVTVGDGAFNGLEFTLGDVQINEGQEFCIPVTVRNFEDVALFTYEVLFDENVIEFVELRSFNLVDLSTGNFNTASADQGRIRTLWTDNSAQGVNVDDGTVIFEYCFVALADCPASTVLENNAAFNGFEALDPETNAIPFLIRPAQINIVCGFTIAPEVQAESCPDACDGEIALNIDGGVAPFDIQWAGPTNIPAGSMTAQNLCAGDYNVTIISDNGFQLDTSFTIESPNAFTVDDISVTNEFLGADGEIELTLSGGSSDFTYSWSTMPPRQGNPLTNVESGTYSVTITDNVTGCELIQEGISVDLIFAVTEIRVDDVSCAGQEDGQAEVFVEGGSGDFSYEWSCSSSTSSVASGLSGGSCQVTITDNETGREIERMFSVGENDPVTINPSIIDDLNGDGSGAIDLNPSGGVQPYTFEWSNESTNEDQNDLSVGLYFVTITDDENCTFIFGPIPVTDGSMLVSVRSSVDEFNGNGVSCFGSCDGYIEIQVFGGASPYQINWSDGEEDFTRNPLCADNYSYTITDAEGDTEEGTVELPEPEEIQVNVVDRGCSNNSDGFIEVEGMGGSAPYMYSFDGNNFSSDNRNEGLAVGSYTLFVRDANDCEAMISYEVLSCSEGECYQAIPVITPNSDGRNDRLIIRCAVDRNNELQIFNRMGQLVFEQENYMNQWEGTNNISGGEVEEGSYIWVLRIFSNGVEQEVQKGTVTVLRNLR